MNIPGQIAVAAYLAANLAGALSASSVGGGGGGGHCGVSIGAVGAPTWLAPSYKSKISAIN